MKRSLFASIAAVAATTAVLASQSADVDKILADARAALGGAKKLAALRTFAATGRSTRVIGEQSQPAADMDVAFELPDRFAKKDPVAVMNGVSLARTTGFNGETVINVMDEPPPMPGRVIIRMGPGGLTPGAPLTPEQQAENQRKALLASRQEFALLALGLLLPETPAFPMKFSYGGQAESPDGKADVVDVTGEGGFAARLFIDAGTHMPLMLSWMAKEPLRITTSFTAGGPGGGAVSHGGGATVVTGGQRAAGPPATPDEIDKRVKQLEEQRKAAEAKLRVVEYRLFYGDYRDVDGIKVPFRLQRSIEGKPTEEVEFEKVKINGKIDPDRFQPKR